MQMRKERIVTFTDEQLRKMEADGKSGSNWEKAAEHPLPDGGDPDDAMEDVDMACVMTEIPMPKNKTHASLRLDTDMLEWFRAQGRGYQTKINAILRSYYQHHTR
jgi:uncharacterized protein (DUF4415 family)